MGQGYRRTKSTVFLINYHFVFCSRDRQKVRVDQVEKRFKQLVKNMSGKRLGNPCDGSDAGSLPFVFERSSNRLAIGSHGKVERSDFQKTEARIQALISQSLNPFFLCQYGWKRLKRNDSAICRRTEGKGVNGCPRSHSSWNCTGQHGQNRTCTNE
jgi:putative transposase